MKPGAQREQIARIGKRLRNIDAQLLALDIAIDDFGDERLSDLGWERAFASGNPDDINRVSPVMSGYEHVVQNVVELGKAASRVTGRVQERRPRAEDAIAALHDAGAISKRGRERLDDLYLFRGRISHDSPDITADEVAAYAERALSEVPRMVAGIRRWLADEGISFEG